MMFFKEMVLLGNMIITINIIVGSGIEFTSPKPSYLPRDQIFNSQFIRLLTVTQTLELKSIKFNKPDIKILTSPTIKKVDEKLTALHKYKTKMQSLLCFNAFIVYYFILNIDMADPSLIDFGSFYEEMTLPSSYDEFEEIDLKKLHNFLNRMISVFYIGQFFVPRWFWVILIDLKVHFLNGESMTIKSKLMEDVLSYIEKCKKLNYLPSTKENHSKVSIPFDEYQKTINIAYIAKPLYDIFDFDKIKETEQLFTLENFKLSSFKSNHDWIYQYNIESIKWNQIKDEERNLFFFNFYRKFIASASFLYQKIIVRIITTKLLIFVWKHIAIYLESVKPYRNLDDSRYCYADLIPDLMRYKLVEFWFLLEEPLNLAVKFLNLYNGPLWNLTQVTINTETLIDTMELEALFNDLDIQLSCEINMFKNSAEKPMINMVIINERTDIKSSTVTQNMVNIKNYILQAKTFLKPLDFYFLQFYIVYNNNIIPMY